MKSARRSTHRLISWALALLAVAACTAAPSSNAAPTATLPPVTRIVSVDTPTFTPAPPTETPTPTATNTVTVTPIPSETPTVPTPTETTVPTLRLVAGGDVMLARSIGDKVLAEGPEVVFAGIQDTLDAADLFVVNLECVIADVGEPAFKSYTFRAPPETADALAAGGVDLVSLANNHSLDYGLDALADMLPALRAVGVETAGAGADAEAARAPVVLERNGLKVAFLSYVDVPVEGRTGFDTRSWSAGPDLPGLAWADPADMRFDVGSARLKADVVVVLLHFGLEGQSKFTDAQQALAHTAIDAGANLVLGAHSHVLQPVETYNGGLIVYSLGNLVFDGFAPPSTSSALFTATLSPAGIVDYAFVPVMVDHGLPRHATAGEAQFINALLAPDE